MDQPGHPQELVRESLGDLARVNRLLGGCDLTMRALDRVAPSLTRARGHEPIRVLDVATGSADIPRAMITHAHSRRWALQVTAIDRSPQALEEARRAAPAQLELREGDALALAFDDRTFDIAACSLMLHHFAPNQAVQVLSEMRRVSGGYVIVNDLVRAWHAYAAARVLARVVTRNKLTRYDGPVSVLRAYTRSEMVGLADQAGLRPLWRGGMLGYRDAWLFERYDRAGELRGSRGRTRHLA